MHEEAVQALLRAGFNFYFSGDEKQRVRREDGSMQSIFMPIRWEGPNGAKREVFPEVVTQPCARTGNGLEAASPRLSPEEQGVSDIQLEILYGLERLFKNVGFDDDRHAVHESWLRKFVTGGRRVIRVLLAFRAGHGEMCIVAELRFWDLLPGSYRAKPI